MKVSDHNINIFSRDASISICDPHCRNLDHSRGTVVSTLDGYTLLSTSNAYKRGYWLWKCSTLILCIYGYIWTKMFSITLMMLQGLTYSTRTHKCMCLAWTHIVDNPWNYKGHDVPPVNRSWWCRLYTVCGQWSMLALHDAMRRDVQPITLTAHSLHWGLLCGNYRIDSKQIYNSSNNSGIVWIVAWLL